MFKNIIENIGNTPIAKLDLETPATILAKLEYLNPGGSIKDRAALFMITQAEKNGDLKPGGTIIEASSGNQGIAIAMIGAFKGYNVIITVPEQTSEEKIGTLKAYGAEVIICPDTKDKNDPRNYLSKAKELLATIPNAFSPNQYINEQNPLAHYTTTGPEIWKQTDGTITHFLCTKGSCGTISGVGRFLKEKNKDIQVISVDEQPSATKPQKNKIEGIGTGMETNLEKEFVDEFMLVSGQDAYDMAKKLAKQGILVGLSSGAVMCAIENYLPKLKPTDVMVTIFADSGRAYLSKI
ncbi:PLP-dependent cysteine synthase family protein [Candidatus Dependentiae bacterium]